MKKVVSIATLLLLAPQPVRSFEGHSRRSDRVRILRFVLKITDWVLQRLRYPHELIIRGSGQAFVRIDGICLSLKATNRYLKLEKGQGVEAQEMHNFLQQVGITELTTFVDIGANFGENNLYFAKQFPDARNIAVEPSPANLAILQENLANQSFDTSSIEVVRKAVTNKSGEVLDLWEANSESTIRRSASRGGPTSKIETIRLADLWERFGLSDVDFVKVDIEGSEPLLVTDLMNLATSAKVWLFEFSFKASRSESEKLMEVFLNRNFLARERDGSFETTEMTEAKEFLDNRSEGTDIYFVREDLCNGR